MQAAVKSDTWPNRVGPLETRSELSKVGKEYNAALKSIALGIAIGETSERVLAPHVDYAFRLLATAGNARKPWSKPLGP